MLMSISTRAGCSRSTRSIASRPLDASPANSKPSRRRSTARAAARNGAWSSTTSTERGLVTRSASHGPPAPPPAPPPSFRPASPLVPASRVLPASSFRPASTFLPLAEEDQHRLDPAVNVLLLRQPQLGEDRVGVLLHGALGDEQGGGDRGVALALGHLGKDLGFPRGQ